jgi:hypothetical protein
LSAATNLAAMPASSVSASVTSAAWPALKRQRARLPSPSTRAWILVVRPPRERPIARAPLFLGASRMPMNTHDRTVDKDLLDVGIAGQGVEDALPDATLPPACEPLVDAVPGPERLGQIAPRRSRAGHPQDRLDEQPIVRRRASAVSGLARQQVCDTLPLIVTPIQTRHTSPHESVGRALSC